MTASEWPETKRIFHQVVYCSLKRYLFFVNVTMLGLVRIFITRYPWKDLSLLTFLLTTLLAETES